MATVLTLEEFRATRQESPDVRMVFGDDGLGYPIPGLLYADNSCCICGDSASSYTLIIYNQEWPNKPLEELEEILYREHYLPEIAGVVEPAPVEKIKVKVSIHDARGQLLEDFWVIDQRGVSSDTELQFGVRGTLEDEDQFLIEEAR